MNTALDASGNVIGYVLTVTAKDASQASITFSVGIKNDGTVNGYSITNIAETPGLGMKAQEEAFYSQFEGKNVDSFTVVKQRLPLTTRSNLSQVQRSHPKLWQTV